MTGHSHGKLPGKNDGEGFRFDKFDRPLAKLYEQIAAEREAREKASQVAEQTQQSLVIRERQIPQI